VKKYCYKFIKRFFDIVLSLLGLIILSPSFLVLAILVKCDSKGPVFYKHKRVGKNGKTIYLYKFRSMVVNSKEIYDSWSPERKAEFEKNFKLDDDERITKIGKVLRKTSLDELPQLLNILGGSMSIIGPRPVVEKELEKFGDNKNKILSAKPGLTGYWAVNGRSDTDYDERVKLECYYVDHASLLLDIKIFFKTIWVVLVGKGAK
jgi:lipopolysaccharide/colanic/teichoic acid biosynthesis glycosyltransferase